VRDVRRSKEGWSASIAPAPKDRSKKPSSSTQRPRARTGAGEVALPTFQTMAATDPLDRRVGWRAQLGDRFKEVRVQHLSSVAPIEAFDQPSDARHLPGGVWRCKLVAIGPPADASAAPGGRRVLALQVARAFRRPMRMPALPPLADNALDGTLSLRRV